MFFNNALVASDQVKYLGVILDAIYLAGNSKLKLSARKHQP